MPQLDSVTFFGQLFWLVILFGTFYLININHCLPTLGQMIKTRRKHLLIQRASIAMMGDEVKSASGLCQNQFLQDAGGSRSHLSSGTENGNAWVGSAVSAEQAGTLQSANEAYISGCASASGNAHSLRQSL